MKQVRVDLMCMLRIVIYTVECVLQLIICKVLLNSLFNELRYGLSLFIWREYELRQNH